MGNILNIAPTGSTIYITPKWLTDKLGPFDVDIAAAKGSYNSIGRKLNFEGPTGSTGCGLSAKLKKSDFVWCNPPWGKKNGEQDFMGKMSEHNNGILLVPSKVTGRGFHDFVYPVASCVLFWRGALMFESELGEPRLNFGGYQGVTLVAYGNKAASRLEKAKDLGVLLKVQK